MRRNTREGTYAEDDLGLQSMEIEELENDEISLGEAGFLHGYEAENEYDEWWKKEDMLIKEVEEKLGEVA